MVLSIEEFLENNNYPDTLSGGTLEQAFKDFAEMHVRAALKKASKEAKAYADGGGEWTSSRSSAIIDKNSILEAYSPENIK